MVEEIYKTTTIEKNNTYLFVILICRLKFHLSWKFRILFHLKKNVNRCLKVKIILGDIKKEIILITNKERRKQKNSIYIF